MPIPKITHQTWLQGWDSVPDKFKTNITNLETHNPDFTHMKWDEKSLREECAKISTATLAKFDSFKYLMQKVDLGRYVVLYNYGGVSVDTDMASFKSISSAPGFNDNDFIISYSAFPAYIIGWVNNALIMCKKHHPLLLDLITNITENDLKEEDFTTKELYIDATTSPSMFNRTILKNSKDILILDNKYFEPCFSVDPLCKPTNDSIMDHQHELSWLHDNLKLLAQVVIILIYFLLFLLIPAILLYFFIIIVLSSRYNTYFRKIYQRSFNSIRKVV